MGGFSTLQHFLSEEYLHCRGWQKYSISSGPSKSRVIVFGIFQAYSTFSFCSDLEVQKTRLEISHLQIANTEGIFTNRKLTWLAFQVIVGFM